MSTAAVEMPLGARAAAVGESRTEAVGWYIWSCVLASACIKVGLYWDISWHMTIGRDTFWTPAHLLIQFGAVLAGLSSAFVIFRATFHRDAAVREGAVKVLGFSGPLGAFLSAWGAAAMLVSAPFDNWWHDAYGLDVKIISPPHQVLGFGIVGISIGAVVMILGRMNRAEGMERKRLESLLLLSGGLIVVQIMMGRFGFTDRSLMHSGLMYLWIATELPLFLEAVARASGARWARTIMAALYTGFFALAEWIFPLFPGEPKLGPVYQHVTHMVPLSFPILILVPALALDWLWPKMKEWNVGLQATTAGVVFVAALMAVQWPFANFLMSPAAANWVFGTQIHPYMASPEWAGVRNVFFQYETTTAHFMRNLGLAFSWAIVSTLLGIVWGNWMRKVQR